MNDNSLIEIINYKGFDIEVHYDSDVDSPDSWGNTDIFLVYDHRAFTVTRPGYDPQEIWEFYQGENAQFPADFWIFPVYAYIHSGIVLSVGNTFGGADPGGWDTSMKGFILASETSFKTREKAFDAAEGLTNTWNEYLSGDVYGYNSEIDGCWGYFGKDGMKQMISEAKENIDWELRLQMKLHLKYLKKMIRCKVPFQYRKTSPQI